MTHPCELFRGALVSYLRGELPPLEKVRLEGHLGHCVACTRLREELGHGLKAAQTYEPEVEPEHLRRLLGRLAPYTEAQAGRRGTLLLAWSGAALVAVSLALVIGVVPWSMRARHVAVVGPAPTRVPVAVTPAPSAPRPVEVVRMEPSPALWLVASANWDGKSQGDDRKLNVTLSRGFVAASFVGGRGRSLRVTTPTTVVEVVGTRFLVEIGEAGLTTVSVAEGKVRIRAGREALSVASGETRSFDAQGGVIATPILVGRDFLDDPYLVTHHAQASLTPIGKKSGKETAPKETWSVLEQLAQAEKLADQGQFEAALTIYQSCVADAAEGYAPYRQLCRLEMARLLGFKLGKLERARDILRRLAKENPDEVGSQSALALCELDLKTNPCRAIACLRDVVTQGASRPELKREAERLGTRWSEGAPGCGSGALR